MKLIAQLQLKPTKEQADALRATMQRANEACDFLSALAWEHKTFGQYNLHKLGYNLAKERFGLSAQVVVRCISKVADAYNLDKKTQRTFKPLGAITYDDRILRYKLAKDCVSIWTLEGRTDIPFVCGERQRELLRNRQGESDLCLVRGKWLLLATCNAEEPKPQDVQEALGVDLGVVQIAVDSDGEMHSGKAMNAVRYRARSLRAKLQKKGTRGAKRRLKKLSGKEARFATWVNHNVAKRIVAKAQCTERAIALEDLKGIRARIKARRPQRATLHSWSFHQLGQFIGYKSKLAGVRLVFIDPRNTSRTCPACGHCEKANRVSQSRFHCKECSFSANADYVGAVNIAIRGAAACKPAILADAV